MANATLRQGSAGIHGDITDTSTDPQVEVGSVAVEGGNAYTYVQFAEALTAGEWITFDETWATNGWGATVPGPVGVVMGAPAINEYGWIQREGYHAAAASQTSVATTDYLIAAASNTVDAGTGTADRIVYGATVVGAESGGFIGVQLDAPWILNVDEDVP